MARVPELQTIIDALDEPSLLLDGTRVVMANGAAVELFSNLRVGSDVRLAIRNPIALDHIIAGEPGDVEMAGIDRPERPWLLSIRNVGDQLVLARLVDRSAARAAEKMRVDFVANASHELRTPLATILGYAETLADGEFDAESNAKFGSIIRSEAQRMLRVVEDLMSLSRIEADRFVAPRDRVDLGEVAETSVSQCRSMADQRSCSIELHIDAETPVVRGDRPQLIQLLDNLIGNALRYGCMGPGSVVRVSVRREGNSAVLSVSDTGEGIPREHLPRLTERFYRVDEARSRSSGGTGLGLAIVKHIVERHRGTLAIRSSPGEGTDVSVRLPLA